MRTSLVAAAAAAILIVLFAYLLWPRPAFHVTNAQIGSKKVGNRVQLFANIYFNNDGTDADFSWSAATGFVRSDGSPDEQRAFVKRLETSAAQPGDAESHAPFAVAAGEDRWFTVYGPLVTPADFRQFVGGAYDFYFAATIVGRSHWIGRTALSFCGFNPGRSPIEIHPCPKVP